MSNTEKRGKRVKRGLYQASNGVKYNADVNESLNILRKVVPNAFSNGIEEPVRWAGFPT
ncbi:hypothetical protein [Okeania sp. SIO3I5]|uniref:hypothetical protein n=1 Tax=Okeania sp. SIO3I5 TaxID=2607805 RepID=UPI002600306A|nr:hypothetical protein [Okeania sp. SIO3I5]